MHYTHLFRTLRESRKLSHETLAKIATCHRNTVINVESGRPVKFVTVALLLDSMSYGPGTPEYKAMALLWAEAATGVNLQDQRRILDGIDDRLAEEDTAILELLKNLRSHSYTPKQISTLANAVKAPGIMDGIGAFYKHLSKA